MENILRVIIVSAASFTTLFVLAKFLGKKQIAQLNFVDYVIGISLGSIAAQMTCDIDTPHFYFVIAMLMFFMLDLLVSFVGRKGPFMKRLIKGKPSVLIYEGEIDYEELKRSNLDINDLLAMCRQQGYFDIMNVHYAILETGGQLSVLPIGAERPTVASDLDIVIEESSLPNHLVIDGKVSYSGLNEIEKDIDWLMKELNLNSKKELKKIGLAVFDSQNQSVVVKSRQK